MVYRGLDDAAATSPIIMSRRLGDESHELKVLARVIVDAYRQWGWSAPEGLDA